MSAIATATAATTWKLDPAHSLAEFKVKHMMISNVKGQFSDIAGSLELDESDVTRSRAVCSVETASVSTREEQRDAHLRSADFFDAEHFPQLTFRSTQVTRKGEEELEVTGELTIRGVTRPVTFHVEGPTPPAKDPWGNLRVGLAATTKISRKDFGLIWNAVLETGGIMVGDEVTITIDAQFIRQ